MSTALSNLGTLLVDLGRYEDGEQLLRTSLELRERQLGPHHLSLATSLNNLAGVYRKRGRYAAAEPLYMRALAIWETNQGQNHPDVAVGLNNLGIVFYEQARYPEAERCFPTGIRHSKEGSGSVRTQPWPSVSTIWPSLYQIQKRYNEAGRMYRESLAICEKTFGPKTSRSCHATQQPGGALPAGRAGNQFRATLSPGA